MSCYKCENRHMGCHAQCPTYAEDSAQREEIRARKWLEQQRNLDYTNYKIDMVERYNKSIGRKTK